MDFWDDIGRADATGETGNYFPYADAQYTVALISAKIKDGFKGRSMILSFDVLESDNPDVDAGDSKDWVLKMSGDNARLAQGNLKAFMCALLGLPKDDKSPQTEATVAQRGREMLGANNPFRGKPILLHTIPIKTKAGGNFTAHNWSTPTNGAAPAPMAAPPPPPPPPPPAVDPAKARAQTTPGWVLPDGRWYNGAAWVGP